MRRCHALVFLALAGCWSEANPCPDGLLPEPSSNRCVPVDAGSSATDASVPLCPETDIEHWNNRFSEPGLVAAINECVTTCADDLVCVIACSADATGLEECRECATTPVSCASVGCRSACTTGTDLECRACMCDWGCLESFDECARVELAPGLCDGVHGIPVNVAELTVRYPFVMRRKSATGATRATAFIPEAPGTAQTRESITGVGWTQLHAFSLRGVEYVLEFMGGCGRARCPVRVAPLLVDGSLGRPLWSDEWDIGWDVFATFVAGSDAYLVQYKSGSVAVEGAPRGQARILRITPEDEFGLRVDPAYEATWSFPTTANWWTHVRAFEVDGTPHLLRYRSTEGDADNAEILRVDVAPDRSLALTRVSRELGWESGWAILETFPVGERWFVLRYAGAANPMLPAGTVRIHALVPDKGGAVVAGPSLLSETWAADLTAIHAFRAGEITYLLRRDLMRAEVVALGSQPAQWQRGRPRVVQSEWWGTGQPPWDVVTIVRARLWSAP